MTQASTKKNTLCLRKNFQRKSYSIKYDDECENKTICR